MHSVAIVLRLKTMFVVNEFFFNKNIIFLLFVYFFVLYAIIVANNCYTIEF